MKNRVGSMLMETGISYNKQKLHQQRYFNQLLRDQANAMPHSMPELLRLSRSTIDGLGQMNKQLLRALHTDQVLADRVQRFMTIRGLPLAVDRSKPNFEPRREMPISAQA